MASCCSMLGMQPIKCASLIKCVSIPFFVANNFCLVISYVSIFFLSNNSCSYASNLSFRCNNASSTFSSLLLLLSFN